MEGSPPRKYLLRLMAGLLLLSGLAFAFERLLSEQGSRTLNLAVFRPGEAKPTMVVKRRLAFDTVTDPIAIGDRFYLLGAKRGSCSAAGAEKDPFVIYAFDPTEGELIELPGTGAPAARTNPHIVTADDGFLLMAGHQLDDDTGCEPLMEGYFWTIVYWSYETFPIDRVYPLDDFLKLATDLVGGSPPLNLPVPIIPETYRYRLSRQAWERVPALDLLRASDDTKAEEPFDQRDGSYSPVSEMGGLVQRIDSGGPPNVYLDSTSEKRITIPALDELTEQGISVEYSWLRPVMIARKLLLYFPDHTISAESAAAINEQYEQERRFQIELPLDQRDPEKIPHTIRPHPGLIFDLDRGSWTPMNSAGAPMPVAFDEFHGAAAAIGDILVVLTGEAKRPGAMYDHRIDRWTPISRKRAPRMDAMKVGRLGDQLVAFEKGDDDDTPIDRTIYLFHPGRNIWTSYPSPPGLSAIYSVSEVADHLLLLSDTHNRLLEWFSPKRTSRTQLLIGPEFSGYQLATTRYAALIYAAQVSDN